MGEQPLGERHRLSERQWHQRLVDLKTNALVCMGAALHFDIAVPNFGIQELMPHAEVTDEVFPHAYTFKSGHLYPGDAPGHGVDFDEKLAAKFPYERAYLPVNRLMDGTLWNW
jgi:mannonate dehydratase